MQLSVVIVNYNVKHYLAQCLYAVEKATAGMDAEVLVFDNDSQDGSVDYLSGLFPHVAFISSSHNLGFAKGNNRAIRQSKGKYVLLLNPDTIVGEKVLHEAVDFMEAHPKAGGAGVRMLKTDGTDAMESRRGIPTPMTAFYKMTGLCNRFPKSRRFAKYYMSYLPWNQPERIEIISGAFCLLRRKALDQVGLLDEDFFMYGEDIDLSYRLLKGGWENWYLPLEILHYKGESTEKSSFRYVHVFYEAMLIFFKKHYGHLSLILSIPVQIAIHLKAFCSLLSMLTDKARSTLGFVKTRQTEDAYYAFYTAPAHTEAAKDFARHKGLYGTFQQTDKPFTDVEPDVAAKYELYKVYDGENMPFEHILHDLSHSTHQYRIAMFYPSHHLLITDQEVMTL